MGNSNKKHCLLIQAHKDVSYYIDLAKKNRNVNIYIHIDKKSTYIYDNLEKINNVFFIKERIKVYWGGFSQVNATLLLLNEAINNKENYFFHLISGEDTLTSSFVDIEKDWLENYNYSIMIECKEALNYNYRVRYYSLFADTKYIRSFVSKINNKINQVINKIFNSNRTYYMGSNWFSIIREDLEILMNIDRLNKEVDFFKKKICPDEHFFQKLIMDDGNLIKKISYENKRYIKFDKKYKNGVNPVYLNLEKLNELKNNYWFSRKVVPQVAKQFLNLKK